MTEQEIINTVWRWFVTKRRARSADMWGCRYLGPRGQRCAVGVLMTKAEARRCDGNGIGGVTVGVLGDKLPKRLRPHINLLDSLQDAHDGGGRARDFSEHMRNRLTFIAANRGLTVPR